MNEIKRYTPRAKYIGAGDYVGDCEEDQTGDYVLHSDFVKKKERVAHTEDTLQVTSQQLADALNKLAARETDLNKANDTIQLCSQTLWKFGVDIADITMKGREKWA